VVSRLRRKRQPSKCITYRIDRASGAGKFRASVAQMRMGSHPPRFMKVEAGVAEALTTPSKVNRVNSLHTLQGRQRPSLPPPAALPQIAPPP